MKKGEILMSTIETDFKKLNLQEGTVVKFKYDIDKYIADTKANINSVSFADIVLMFVNYKSNRMYSVVDIKTFPNEDMKYEIHIVLSKKGDSYENDIEATVKYLKSYGIVECEKEVHASFDTLSVEEAIIKGEIEVFGDEDLDELKKALVDEDGSYNYIQQFVQMD